MALAALEELQRLRRGGARGAALDGGRAARARRSAGYVADVPARRRRAPGGRRLDRGGAGGAGPGHRAPGRAPRVGRDRRRRAADAGRVDRPWAPLPSARGPIARWPRRCACAGPRARSTSATGPRTTAISRRRSWPATDGRRRSGSSSCAACLRAAPARPRSTISRSSPVGARVRSPRAGSRRRSTRAAGAGVADDVAAARIDADVDGDAERDRDAARRCRDLVGG